MMLALSQPAVRLSIAPWAGGDLQTTSTAAAKYRLEVAGPPHAVVRLMARDVATGWLAAFCTRKYCSPQRVEDVLPASGVAIFQFELIRESDTAPKASGAVITGADGVSVTVPTAYR
jgi:hypothetical protein